jgi:lauroyl/myristoyl acyltransferase
MKKNTTTSVILGIFGAIPRNFRRKICIVLFMLFYHVSPRRRLIAIHNLKRAFPERNMNEIIEIAKGVYRNMAIVAVDFFGRPACTTNGLALHTWAPVLPGYAVRLDDGCYRFVFGQEVELVRTGDREQDILVNTQNFTRIVEATVRQYPDQWLWVHQRWKTTMIKETHPGA